MKCPLCNSKMAPEEVHVELASDDAYPDFCQDYWCDKGHLVQAIACQKSTGWQVLILNHDGDELFAFWYTTDRVLTDITDWSNGAFVWAP